MKKFTKMAYAIFVLLCCNTVLAQELTITGTVTDNRGIPLPGTNISVVNSTKGAQTDFDGFFTIEANKGDQLLFSYVGFLPQTVTVTNETKLEITMQENVEGLDQIVIIGYGTSTKKKIATSIGTIRAEDIEDIKFPSIQSLFTGQVTGVQVAQLSGRVESGFKVRVRGVSTVGASQEPLYVLDGVPLINEDESINNSPINPLIGLNPNDVESIDFLKDAAAAAIYGARGTNGVVIITTKKGTESKPKITLNTSTGLNFTTKKRDFLNAAQYIELYSEAAQNSGVSQAEIEARFDELALGRDWRNGEVDTDWQELAFQESVTTDLNVAASGGTDKAQYYMSTSYNKTGGIILGNGLDRYTLRGKTDVNITEKSKAGFNINLSKVTIDRISNDNSFISPLQSVAQSPLTPALLEDGTANVDGNSTLYQNFLGQEQTGRFVTDIWRTTANIYGDFYINDHLNYVSEAGYDSNRQSAERFSGSLTEFASVGGFGTVSTANTERYILTNYLKYNTTIGSQFDISATLGGSFEETTRASQFTTGQQFPSDDLQTLDNAVIITNGGSNKTKYNFLSYFARSRFDYANKYAMTLSIRRDGSSRFGSNSQFGWFPAASAAWTVSNESFLSNSQFLSSLKLRASWGITGNAEIGNFASQNLYGLTSYDRRIGVSPIQLGDPELKWEKTTQYDFGVDFGLFNNVVTGEIDYYNKTTNDLLFNQPVPGTSGFTSIVRNVGEMENKGIEVRLSTNIISNSDFNWNLTGLFTRNVNTLTNLPSGDIIDGVNILREGESLSSFYLYEYAGVDSDNGDALYYINSVNADGSLNRDTTNDVSQANRIVVGNPFPEFQVSLNSSMKFNNFDFAFILQGEYGASIFDQAGKFTSGNAQFFDNQTVDQLNRWQNPGDITDVPQARLNEENGQADSTRYLQNADFIRLRNVTLGYTIDPTFSSKFYLDKVRFYFSGLNLLTLTDYDGYDPQSTADFNGNSGVRSGVSFYSAPPAKSYTFGVNVEF
ncbi:SusC/RagA family TonB-linked outer membrane protein [Aquimarina brevivitae]|uniref:TonB-linked SusC/RagA family outer membrane protein n=1 Tax=Aquimarina brevivitae TaxID=323412 RepID=A0A4Q7PHX8_9FLAO|nr:TonB-dependent receptor [Aquimarina brevivitae]RZT00202.1 TonB-linked SusC/RagA family outer membrane protein [Aquimarina brevivitae]